MVEQRWYKSLIIEQRCKTNRPKSTRSFWNWQSYARNQSSGGRSWRWKITPNCKSGPGFDFCHTHAFVTLYCRFYTSFWETCGGEDVSYSSLNRRKDSGVKPWSFNSFVVFKVLARSKLVANSWLDIVTVYRVAGRFSILSPNYGK